MNKTDILVINPGSTSTKIGLYREGTFIVERTIRHDAKEVLSFGPVKNQKEFRRKLIEEILDEIQYDRSRLKAVVARGPMVIGLKAGGYVADQALCEASSRLDIPQHACNLGALLAFEIARPLSIKSFIYDSVMGCELSPVAKASGLKEIERYGCYHVLNSRAQARKYAQSIGKKYEELNLLVCHLGGGTSVSAHANGKIVDGVSYDEGPMSPERIGSMSLTQWTRLCYSGKYTEAEAEKLICGKGGLYSYFNTTNCLEIEDMIEQGNENAINVYEAMAYQVAKAIAEVSVAMRGKIDKIILTGGIAHSEKMTKMIMDYCPHIGDYIIMAGEEELSALAQGAERILSGEEAAAKYERK